MRMTMMMMGTLALGSLGSDGRAEAKAEKQDLESAKEAPRTPTAVAPVARRLYLDVHDLGRGKVTAQEAAGAHQKDLAAQGKHGVSFKAYWVDARQGRIYCLA